MEAPVSTSCSHDHQVTDASPRAGIVLAAAASLPFLLGHLITPGTTGDCPVLQATGLPCPGCGAARAFEHIGHGSADFLRFNWLWVLVAAATIVYGVLVAVRARAGKPAPASRLGQRPLVIAGAAVAVALLGWLVALSNLDAIRG